MKLPILLTFLFIQAATLFAQYPPIGGGEYVLEHLDEITPEQYADIKNMIAENMSALGEAGKLPEINSKTAAVALELPLAWNDGFTGYNFYTIYNFVDHNPAFPNIITDFACGTRSYDTDGGYNHQGIDYVLWPFEWNLMAEGAVKIIASAPGMIVAKTDGGFDQNCSFNPGIWNAVYVRHDDGSIAWYGHMKNGSLTDKGLGDLVETGEYLGLVGSSGNSTAPHLHFELFDADDNLIDPYSGACNTLNADSWWIDQPGYFDPEINRMQTHDSPPNFNFCPELADINDKNTFMPGENVVFAFYAKDLRADDLCALKIERADGTVFDAWNFFQGSDYAASYWYWTNTLPIDAVEGYWKWSCTLLGEYYEHEFLVGEVPANIKNIAPIKNVYTDQHEETVNIHFSAEKNFQATISITNLNGQTIYSNKMHANEGKNYQNISFSLFSSGVYLLQITDENTGLKTAHKFIFY